jgi:hypothetical protein
MMGDASKTVRFVRKRLSGAGRRRYGVEIMAAGIGGATTGLSSVLNRVVSEKSDSAENSPGYAIEINRHLKAVPRSMVLALGAYVSL